jgi:hypothetical protein
MLSIISAVIIKYTLLSVFHIKTDRNNILNVDNNRQSQLLLTYH